MSNYPSGYTEPESLDDHLSRLNNQIDLMRGLLLWALYHHQGANSEVGQPIRKALGIGEHDRLTEQQIIEAKKAVSKINFEIKELK
jgi:hypothetical protein